MLSPFSAEDLGRIFDARVLTRGRSLLLLGAVDVAMSDDAITATVDHAGFERRTSIVPSKLGNRVVFDSTCSCAQSGCVHLAATGLAALDRFPALRKATQKSLFDAVTGTTSGEKQVFAFELAPAEPPAACAVTTLLVGERTGRQEPTTPAQIMLDKAGPESNRILAKLLGGGTEARVTVPPAQVASVLGLIARIGRGKWHANGKTLVLGEERAFQANVPPNLPPKSAVILGESGPWYVDGATGQVGRVRLRTGPVVAPAPAPAAKPGFSMTQAAARPAPHIAARLAGNPVARPGFAPNRPPSRPSVRQVAKPVSRSGPTMVPTVAAEPIILERAPTPILQLRRLDLPDDFGRMTKMDALIVDFDYDGVAISADDEKQFVRMKDGSFVRRDRETEAGALGALRQDGFVQMRVADPGNARGRMVHVHRGRDAAERWQAFIHDRVPTLQALGWQNKIDRDFGPRTVQSIGEYDVKVSDAERGRFALDFGIEIDGTRVPLLPILTRLLDRGGMDAAQITDGELVTSLEDGRILKLPAERIRRLLAVMADLIDAAHRTVNDELVLSDGEAATVLDLEDLLTTRWDDSAAISAYAEQFRSPAELPQATIPDTFKAELRPYQALGVAWLQHLREANLGGFLADDMGLGKTAQTIAHLVIEHAEGRLDRPALIVVPTSLVANWSAELKKFAPHLRVEVLHGLDRHERRAGIDSAPENVHVVITTYTVLSRDIEVMVPLQWHIVVLDEAQVIKSPDSKATRAVCRLDTRHRLCLSGTPIENNLQELWSEFAFLMPNLLGDRKSFSKRFRTPIEKNNDQVRRVQLARRIKPFLLRRTKGEVATDLPPKHTILRRINLAPEQREVYDTIRGTLSARRCASRSAACPPPRAASWCSMRCSSCASSAATRGC